VPVNDHICKGFGLSLWLTFNPDRNGAQEAVLELGENVVNIGFPLQSLMTDAPTVTRGTLSSRAGLNGSLGQFQFSAPIQPGASGGPVIGARGDVVGVAVGTLNAQELLKQGVLPQNVNFALEAQYVQKFLHNKAVAFTEGAADPHISPDVPIDNVRVWRWMRCGVNYRQARRLLTLAILRANSAAPLPWEGIRARGFRPWIRISSSSSSAIDGIAGTRNT
jgi:hypothetical protein